MKCYKCQKEVHVALRGMCPACFEYYSKKDPSPVGEIMHSLAQELCKDPDTLHRARPDYKAQRDLLRAALIGLVEEVDPVKLVEMKKVLEKAGGKDSAIGIKAIDALLATLPEN